MPSNQPNRNQATAREILRESVGQTQDWRFPDAKYREGLDKGGKLLCPTCHAISLEKRWFLDPEQYEKLRTQSDVQLVQCPGCERIDRGIFEGRVLLSGDWLAQHKEEILNLIRNEEAKARQTNPLSRLGTINDQGSQVEILVTTQWLAERIGKELRKAYKGELQIDHLKGDKSSRIWWRRD